MLETLGYILVLVLGAISALFFAALLLAALVGGAWGLVCAIRGDGNHGTTTGS